VDADASQAGYVGHQVGPEWRAGCPEWVYSTQSTDLSLVVSPGAYTVSVGIQGGKPFCAAKQITVTAGQTVVLACTEAGWGN
jgi:hypothetical protein